MSDNKVSVTLSMEEQVMPVVKQLKAFFTENKIEMLPAYVAMHLISEAIKDELGIESLRQIMVPAGDPEIVN